MSLEEICSRCPERQRPCFGPCACLADPAQRDVIELIQIRYCPLKKFSWLARLRATFARKLKPKPQPNPITGPALWAELHQWALYGEIDRPLLRLEKFAEKLGAASIGCQCVAEWKAWMLANPVNVESRDTLFAWTVDAHNSVNVRLGKPQMGVEEAKKKQLKA